MATKKTSWGFIILGIATFVVIVGVGLVAVAGFVIYKQFAFQSSTTTSASAERELTQAAEQFAGQLPLLEIRNGEPRLNKKGRQPASAAKPIESLHILVWQSDERKLVKLNIPFWLLRMTKGRPIKLSGNHGADDAIDPVRLNITAEDLERYGPGLVLDHKETGGDRVLVWAR
jgi:hypothetical protein